VKKERKDISFIKKPIYKGGLKSLRAFIRQQLQYPPLAISNGVEGTVLIKYKINYKGIVVKTNVIKGIGHGCDKEAVRLVKLLQFEVAKTRNLKIVFQKSIQIHFKLEQVKQATIKYHYISSESKQSSTPNHYSISIT